MVQLPVDAEVSIEVLDYTGRVIFKEEGASGEKTIDLNDQVAGVYILKVSSGNQTYIEKLIKK